MGSRVVVVGSNFAGLTAAIELRERLGTEHEVLVVSKTDEFLFFPSLIWVPFGLREKTDISFPIRPVLERKGVAFRHSAATSIDLAARQVLAADGTVEPYDYLVIATGPSPNYAAVPGLGPRGGHTESIMTWDDAVHAREAFERFLREPGPVVVGGVQGASCFGAAYEFLFNMAHQLGKRGLRGKVPLTYLSAEPFLAHFGIGGFGSATPMTEWFFRKLGIEAVLDVAVREVAPGRIILQDGREIPFAYSMLVPPFLGVEAVRSLPDVTNAAGFVRVDEFYRTAAHPEVFAAGVAVAVDPPDPTPVPCGVPKTGYLSEEMARVVAHNVAATIRGEKLIALPPGAIDAKCVLDAGNSGIIMLSDRFLEPREHAWLIPGPEAHWAKLAFEKYFLATRKRGRV